MVSTSHRNGTSARGRGRSIVVAGIATVGGVGAMFAYHTSPGHGSGVVITGAVAATGAMAPDTAAASTPQPAPATAAAAAGPAAMAGSSTTVRRTVTAPARLTITGQPADTVWGVVQVQLTVKSGKIIKAAAIQSPHGTDHSIGINQYAVPILDAETVKAGNAMIDSVSGATVTSGGYQQSLQSAVDQAHLG